MPALQASEYAGLTGTGGYRHRQSIVSALRALVFAGLTAPGGWHHRQVAVSGLQDWKFVNSPVVIVRSPLARMILSYRRLALQAQRADTINAGAAKPRFRFTSFIKGLKGRHKRRSVGAASIECGIEENRLCKKTHLPA